MLAVILLNQSTDYKNTVDHSVNVKSQLLEKSPLDVYSYLQLKNKPNMRIMPKIYQETLGIWLP